LRKHCIWLLVALYACSPAKKSAVDAPSFNAGSLKLLSEYVVPHNLPFKGTTVGGLSGIDYDIDKDVYYLICDDRSAINPARFYTAKVHISNNRIDSVSFIAVTNLQQPDGNVYPDSKQNPSGTPDPEALRYDLPNKRMIWSSEGERIIRGKDTVLANPSISIVSPEGKFIDTFPLPANLRMHAIEKGPRQNGVLEGMSFGEGYRSLYVNVEEPLFEDGSRAETTPNDAWIRIYRFDTKSKKNTAQYAYKLDPVAYPATPETAFKVNGIPDILYTGNDKMIILERSYSTGRLACTIKIFLADLKDAENIISNPSLRQTPPVKPVLKKLLLNMDALGIYVDNVEGITFGPTLPNGHRTLLLVADNNFVALEKTQFFLFELIP
jgi:hypothetical protein